MSPEIVEENELAAAPAPAKKSKKKLAILGAAAAVVLLGGGGAGYMMLSGGSAAEAKEEASADHGGGAAEGQQTFVDVPALVVNMRSPDGAARFLKIHFMFVPGKNGSEKKIEDKLPLILDSYQPFLRELRPEDVSGSAAVFRLKEELLRRAVAITGADMIDDVLIQDLVQQ